MNLLTFIRFLKERFTKKGREASIERKLTEQANKGKVNTEVLVGELERRNFKYRSPIVTVGDYRHTPNVDGVPKAMRNIVVRDYDLDEAGKVRPFIQELLQTERMQQITIDTERDAIFTIHTLNEAERLLKYAAQRGIDIDPAIRDPILRARAAASNGLNVGTVDNLLTALTNLTVRVRPVTVESLNWSDHEDTTWHLRRYYCLAIVLAFIIGSFSLATFVASAISSVIRADIVTCNELAVKLRVQLGPLPNATLESMIVANSASAADIGQIWKRFTANTSPPSPSELPPVVLNDVITELQLFASTIRAIDSRAQQLNWLVLNRVQDPFADYRKDKDKDKMHIIFELPNGLRHLDQAASERTAVYQTVRSFAQNILDEVSFYYGAITACILPVLYALFGACAYLLRSAKVHIRNKSYIPSYADSARFMIAGIGGAVVGLFNNFSVTQGATISPLALAFLVGYAVDVFYAFLDGLLRQFKNAPAPPDGKKPS